MGRRRCDEELAAHYATYPIEEEISPITVCRLQEIVASFAPYRRLGTLIDVGAGSGHLLEAASRAGWDAHAVEYGPQQRARLAAQGFRLRPPRLETEAAAGAFDVAVLQEVIEHLRDPAAELAAIATILRPGGLLYITCPNYASLSRRVLGARWAVISDPEHLNYFTPRNAPVLRRATEIS